MKKSKTSRPLRVRAYTVRAPIRGYIGLYPTEYQDLQEKHWWGWKTIDTEEVPAYVRISSGALGDTGGWVSKFARLGSFGRDGLIRPRKLVLLDKIAAGTATADEQREYARDPHHMGAFVSRTGEVFFP